MIAIWYTFLYVLMGMATYVVKVRYCTVRYSSYLWEDTTFIFFVYFLLWPFGSFALLFKGLTVVFMRLDGALYKLACYVKGEDI